MLVDVVLLPRDLEPERIRRQTVVVFDVLRATTSMAAALAAGIAEIRIFDDLDSARHAATAHGGPRLLCGEKNCLPPPGFDLGNSPGAFAAALHAGHTMFMSTTNGTRAVVAAREARVVLVGSLVNAAAAARCAAALGHDTTLLCAGTQGRIAMEDLLGAGAVLEAMKQVRPIELASDTAQIALHLFQSARHDLVSALRQSQGGKNVIDAGLKEDIDFAARLNSLPVGGLVQSDPLRVVSAQICG